MPKNLDENSPIPLYFQLQEIVRKKILDGEYKVGELIPSESEFQRIYNVSRITVRNAMKGLEFDDLLVRKQGKGTIVASARLQEDFSSLKSFTEKMRLQNVEIKTQVLEVERIGASERIAAHLQLSTAEEVLFVYRLRFADSEPLALFSSYLRSDLGAKEEEDFTESMYWLIENRYGRRISYADRIVEARMAADHEAKLLRIQPGECVMSIRNTTYDTEGIPIEYAEGIYRSDRYKYTARLKR